MDSVEADRVVESMLTHPRLKYVLKKRVLGDYSDSALAKHIDDVIQMNEPGLDDLNQYPNQKESRKKCLVCTRCKKPFATVGLISVCHACRKIP